MRVGRSGAVSESRPSLNAFSLPSRAWSASLRTAACARGQSATAPARPFGSASRASYSLLSATTAGASPFAPVRYVASANMEGIGLVLFFGKRYRNRRAPRERAVLRPRTRALALARHAFADDLGKPQR